MFLASKLLIFLTQPLAWVGALVLAALVLLRPQRTGLTADRRGRWGLRTLWLALFVLLRAAEFVHVGLRSSALVDDWAWLLEVLGAALVGWGALRGTVTTERARP
mgnify:CR=1 FL=1